MSVKLLTEEEAAAIAQVCTRTIRRLIEAGKLTAANFGNGKRNIWRIHPDELARVQPAQQPAPVERKRRRRVQPDNVQASPVWPPPSQAA